MNKSYRAISAILFSTALSLNVFWIVNIFKEAYPAIKNILNFYPVTGPLLGLYLITSVIFVLSYAIARQLFQENMTPRWVIRCFVVSTILFFFIVFPPVWEPIVSLIK